MHRLPVLVLAAVLVCSWGASVAAHEETFKGAVVSLGEPKAKETPLQVNVVDPKTRNASARTFIIDPETKIFRGTAKVTLAQAQIQKGDTVAVTVNHDLDEELAIEIHLEKAK